MAEPGPELLSRQLKMIWGLAEFRPGQAEAVAALVSGRDVCVVQPTGWGKSVIFQLAGILRGGTTLVVAPLLSLIRDQLRHLRRLGIARCEGLGSDRPREIPSQLDRLRSGELAFCYVSPERLRTPAFRRTARALAERGGVGLVAVDEAHCISQWGHDFRPAYAELGRLIGRALGARRPPVAALTATASPAVLEEVRGVLGMLSPAEFRAAGFDRPELRVRPRLVGEGEQMTALCAILTRDIPEGRFGPGLVFCPDVEGPRGAVEAASELLWREGVRTLPYTGRPPSGWSKEAWGAAKSAAADDFARGGLPVLCGTSALGLGLHKGDVRWTVHMGLPAGIEAFRQESGRAGRDGLPAQCWIALSCRSERRARKCFESQDAAALARRLGEIGRRGHDDVVRALMRHAAAFPGAESELADCRTLLPELGALGGRKRLRVRVRGAARGALERAFSRLAAAGVLEVLAWSGDGEAAAVELAGGFSPASALEAAAGRIAEVYARVEPARRGSLKEVWDLAMGLSGPRAGGASALDARGSPGPGSFWSGLGSWREGGWRSRPRCGLPL